jgi:transcription elongation GreA/GreB family factor
MNVQQMKGIIAAKDFTSLDTAWLQAMEEKAPSADMAATLEAVVQAGQLDMAEALGYALLGERQQQFAPAEMLELARAVVTAVPDSDQLRAAAGNLYRANFGANPLFDTILRISGLLSGQAPRRAFRTLDTCLALPVGTYLANRFENQVLHITGFDTIMEQFEAADAAGRRHRLDPPKIGDEYEIVTASDFRVMCLYRPEDLVKLLASDPASVLVGICQAHGGKIDVHTLQDWLTPKYLADDAWSGWWSKARTAAKRCSQLSLAGRPIVVTHYPNGRSLEEDMAAAVKAAKMPLEHLTVLEQYVRESRARKTPLQPAFVEPTLKALAQQAASFQASRPGDALAAALAIGAAVKLGLPAPTESYPSPAAILASASKPVPAIAHLDHEGLFEPALEALCQRPDAIAQLSLLMLISPPNRLDDVAARLIARGANDAVELAASEASADPIEHLDLFLWLYKGPAQPPANIPGKLEMLSRLLNVVQELDNDFEINAAVKKEVRHRIRAALSGGNYGTYRAALAQMNEGVAATIKRRIELCTGLAQAVYGDMMNILRENFYGLFVKARVDAWLDENAIYTTEAGLHSQEKLLKEIIEIKMLENARAIGEAAAHGDLSENSEWKFAIEERDLLRARAKKLQDEIARAMILRAENVPTDTVGIGSKVLLKRTSDGKELELSFLGPWDSDLSKNICSYNTGLGLDLMGKAIGDTVMVKMEGLEGEYRIERLASAVEKSGTSMADE